MAYSGKWDKELIIQELKNLSLSLRRKPKKIDSANLYFLTRKFFGSWNNALKEAGFQVKKTQIPKLPISISPSLAYFIGLVITDGHIVFDSLHKKYKVMIFNSYDEEKEVIISLIKELFEYQPSIRKKKYGFNKRFNYEIYISSKRLAEYLINKFKIPANAKCKIIRVPDCFFSLDKKNVSNFVRGVIDGDGSISKSYVKLASNSRYFLNDMKNLLKTMGVDSKKILKEKDRDSFYFYVSSINNLKNLYAYLYKDECFFYKRKKEAWEKIFKSSFGYN